MSYIFNCIEKNVTFTTTQKNTQVYNCDMTQYNFKIIQFQ